MTDSYPIPIKINITIIMGCTALYFSILYSASHTHAVGFQLLFGLAFGIVMIPIYSLMHEAAHNALHPKYKWNVFFGRWLCCLFVVSFTFFRHCHLKHHKKNRTDEEMWDLYYEHQNKWSRYGNLYLMMIGFGYLALWLAVILFAIYPRLVYSSIFKRHVEIKGFLEGGYDVTKLKVIQIESIIVILSQVVCLWLMKWNFTSWLILFLINGFIWSSQNYVNHAFSPRYIINGAHNLKVPVLLKLIYLNFNLHLAHHQNPKIPWIHLPAFIKSGKGRLSFFKNYLRLWKGPMPTKEPSPKTDPVKSTYND